jgi:hypothetical protein
MHRGLGDEPDYGYSWAIHLYEVRFNQKGEAYWWTCRCLDYLTGDNNASMPPPYILEKLHEHARKLGVQYRPNLYCGSSEGLSGMELLAGLDEEES